MKIEVELPDVVAAEMRKKDRRIDLLEKRNEKLETENKRLADTMKSIAVARKALVDAAMWIDPWAFADD